MKKKLTEVEFMALEAGAKLFRYRPVGEAWRSGFYMPSMHKNPKDWLEKNNFRIAEIDLCPSSRPEDVSAEAWALILEMRKGRA